MTTEQIIQRLLDKNHITVKEAFQMIKDLVKKEVILPTVYPKECKPVETIAVAYGVSPINCNAPTSTVTSYSITTTDKI